MADRKLISRADSVNGLSKMKPRAQLQQELAEVARMVANHQAAKGSVAKLPRGSQLPTTPGKMDGK
jgi:hypothetical protein